MDTHTGVFWLIVKAVVILTAAMVLWDIVSLVRKASGGPPILPQYLGRRGLRSICLIALAAIVSVATVVEAIARQI